jgi:hypothetical protein
MRRSIEITDAGDAALARTLTQPIRGRRKRIPRAQAILQAVEKLEIAIPRDSELAVGSMFAHVEDVLSGLRQLASRMNSGS